MMTSRRTFLAGLGASLGVSAVAWPRVSLAAAPTDRLFIVVLLRGGMDGLNTVVPWGDESYTRTRGKMALSGPDEADGVLDLPVCEQAGFDQFRKYESDNSKLHQSRGTFSQRN